MAQLQHAGAPPDRRAVSLSAIRSHDAPARPGRACHRTASAGEITLRGRMLTYADASGAGKTTLRGRMLTYADASGAGETTLRGRMLTYADVC